MKTVTVQAGATIDLGYQYDNYATEVIFPAEIIEPITDAFGSTGTFAIWYRRSGDSLGYPIGSPLVTFDSANDEVTWDIVESDTASPGVSQVQLRYIVDEVCVMSQIFAGNVADSVDTGTEVPEPMEQWADAIVSAGAGGQPTVATSVSAMSDHNTIYLYTGSESGYIYGHIYYWNGSAWTDGGAYGGVSSSGTGLTDDIKQALLDCFEHVAWTDEHGQDYVDALEAALYPPANLLSISAVYTQSGAVYDTASLDDLKPDLVVTAHYDNGTSETVTNYTLSGTLAVGTSTVTVSYGGKTTTFSVTVTEYPSYSITYNLTNVISSNDAVKVSQGGSYTTTLSYDDTQYVLPLPTITMGGVDVTANYYDSASRTLTINNVTGNIVITAAATGLTEIPLLECGIANTNGGMKVYSDNEQTQIGNPGVYGYGALRIAPVIFAQDTTIRVTFTNETSSTMNKGSIYLGSLDPFYKANQTQYSNIYAVITTANLEAGASVTREFTVKAGHYPVIEYSVSGTSKYTITALSYGEPKTITTVKEWVCNTRPGTITWYASSDGSGDANTITNYPYISYAPVPADAGNAVVCVSHKNEETLITGDIASGDFSGAAGSTASDITAYNWATFNANLRIIGNLPMLMNITKRQGMQKLFRGTNSNTAFNSIKEVTL